jgi:ankyrin repeat protein
MSYAAEAKEEEGTLLDVVEQFFYPQGAPYKICYSLDRPDKRFRWDEPDRTGTVASPLYYAALGGLSKTVQLLLAKNADVNVQGGYFGNILQAASFRGHKQVVELLLEKNADVNAQGGEYGNALYAASEQGHEQVAKLLLENNADINAQDGFYCNALIQLALIMHHIRTADLSTIKLQTST